MPGEVPEIIAGMGPWAQHVYNAIMLAGVSGFGIWQYVQARSKEKAKADDPERSERRERHEPFDPEDLLETSPVKRFLASVETIADGIKLQTEAQRTISAALVTLAKVYEQDFDELRVYKAVQERFAAEEARRERWLATQRGPPSPGTGWGGGMTGP